LPFIGTIQAIVPGNEVVVIRRLDVREDLFLRDHTIGGQVSRYSPELTALPVLPLAVSVEMLVEAASLLCPNKILIGMKQVVASRWVVVEKDYVEVELRARLTHSALHEIEILVEMIEVEDPKGETSRKPEAIIRGTVIFGHDYPKPEEGRKLLINNRPSKCSPNQYYREIMFHGPRFQSIAKINHVGTNGIETIARVLPKDTLFHSIPSPQFLLDPLLVDAAGQSVGFWAAEELERGFVVFPTGFESLRIYGAPPACGAEMKVHTTSLLLEDGRIKSDINFETLSGHPWISFQGWHDKRFDFPRSFVQFVLSPTDHLLAERWDALHELVPMDRFVCCRLNGLPQAVLNAQPGSIWPRAWARIILSPREQATWHTLRVPEKRRREWLIGRLVAKDSVRLYLKERYGVQLCPADIEIIPDRHGRPEATGAWTRESKAIPLVSIAHTEEIAVCVAGDSDDWSGVGIDIEMLGRRRDGIEEVAFNEKERILLSGLPEEIKEEWVLRMFCAKEAVAKAVGLGMCGNPRNLEIQTLDQHNGKVSVCVVGELATQLPEWRAISIICHTSRMDNLVVALSFIENNERRNKNT
jgi:phosphopantetheine--protein transferase-like protein